MPSGTPNRSERPAQLSIMEEAGQKLKRVRERHRLTYREVEEASLRIVEANQNEEFGVALSRLSDIENKGTLPSIYRLYTLCAIYKLSFEEVLSWYGVKLGQLASDACLSALPRTHLVGVTAQDDSEVLAPLSLDPGIDLSKTELLSRLIQRWGKFPLMLLNHLDLKNQRYGFIGTEDRFMYPLISPGALVMIDEDQRRINPSQWSNEFERPIYFLEHRGGYSCGWCTLKDERLIVQPHPASGCDPEVYLHPSEIEVVGLVTGVAMTIDAGLGRRPAT